MIFYSIKYLESRGKIEEFEGEIYDGSYACSRKVKVQTSPGVVQQVTLGEGARFEKLGSTAFTVKADAVLAGAQKLKRALAGLEKKRARIGQILESLQSPEKKT